MAQFIFAYHGGKKPDSPEEGAKVMEAWKNWMGSMGDALIVPGAPVGMSKTVSASIDAASEMAKGCPMVVDGDGSVEVAEILEM